MTRRLDWAFLIIVCVAWFGLGWFWGKRSNPTPSETTVIKQRMSSIEEELFDIERRVINIEQRWITIENKVFPYDERFGKNEKE